MPNNRIHKLSPLLINQIAAGEVVTRPASVVKELIENAIDAHATHIRIDIEQGGLGLIQISDNGNGIHPEDMALAVTRHATSKLADVGELVGIDSLGFRGEALASIAAISHLTLTSSHDDSGIGQQLTLSGSDVSQATIRPIVKHRGTCVSVRDLYFNVPGRRSHLKSIATEFAHIEQVVQRLAISFADVQIELYHQEKLRFSLAHASQTQSQHLFHQALPFSLSRLEQALNMPLAQIAQPFYLSLQGLQALTDTGRAQVTGWLFIADKNNLPKLIYINQRLVSDLAISQALQKVARKLGIGINNPLQMGYALFFELPAAWINVNIHPSKQQVKIQPLTNMLAWLSQRVLEQLQSNIEHWQTEHRQINEQNADNKGFSSLHNVSNGEKLNNDVLSLTDEPQASKKSYQVAENQLSYDVQSSQQFEAVVAENLPKLLTIISHNHQQYALVFWQQTFYLLDLKKIKLLNEDKAAITTWLKQTDMTQLANHAIQVGETDMLQWLLSQQPNNQS